MTDARDDPDAELDALVRAAVAAEGAAHPAHPDADALVDHCLGLLPPAADERLREHLAVCVECTQVVVDLEEIATTVPAGQEGSDAEVVRAWDELDARMKRRLSPAGARPRARRNLAWALAAAVAVVLGLLVWNLALRRGLERTRLPRADLQLVDLAPVERGRGSEPVRGPARPVEVVLRPGVARLVLRLNLGELESFPHYGLALQAPDGRRIWQEPEARRAEDGSLLLEVPVEKLGSPGTYKVVVESRRGVEIVTVAEYVLQLRRR